MGRLIDADSLKHHIEEVVNKQSWKDTDLVPVRDIPLFIDEEPTAFDVEKVVEELEALKDEKELGSNKVMIKEAIEIVKQGGVADNACEWKIDGVYIHSPHIQPFVTFIADDEDYRYNFCPVCGKKIKVVE